MLNYTDKSLFPKIMKEAFKRYWFLIIVKLRTLGVTYDKNDLEKIASSNQYDQLDKLRKELNLPLDDLYPFIFSESENFNENVRYYLKNVFDVRCFAINYDLMSKACKFGDGETLIYLLNMDVAINIETIFDYEANIADISYDWPITKAIINRCSPEIKD